jgi:hypothetical protein
MGNYRLEISIIIDYIPRLMLVRCLDIIVHMFVIICILPG